MFTTAEALQILGLQNGATEDEVRIAYKDLIRIWHPDRYIHDARLAKRAEEMTKKLNRAYEHLQRVGTGIDGKFTRESDQRHEGQERKDESNCRAEPNASKRPWDSFLKSAFQTWQALMQTCTSRIKSIRPQLAVELLVYPSVIVGVIYALLTLEIRNSSVPQVIEAAPIAAVSNAVSAIEVVEAKATATMRFPQKRLFEKTIADFDRAIQESPGKSESYLERGKAYLAEGQLELAIIDFDIALKLDAKSGTALRQRAIAFEKSGQFDRAIADYQEAIRVDPIGEIIPAYEVGGVLQLGAIIIEFRKAENKTPDNASVQPHHIRLFNEGNAELKKENWESAIGKYNSAIKLNPAFAEAFLNRAYANYRYGMLLRSDLRKINIASTLDDLSRAIAITPDFSDAYYNKVVIAIVEKYLDASYIKAWSAGTEDNSDLLPDLTRAIESAPESKHAYVKRGQILFALKRFDEAFSDFNNVISLDPQWASGFVLRGVALLRLEEFDEAVEDFSQAIALDPRNASNYLLRGLAFARDGKTDQAVEDYTDGLRQTDAKSYIAQPLYFSRGNAHLQKADSESAILDYSEPIRAYLAKVTKHPDKWRSYVRNRDSEYPCFNRGIAHVNKSDFASAIIDFSEAIHANPTSLRSYLNRGAVYLTIGELEKSNSDLQTAKQLLLEAQLVSR